MGKESTGRLTFKPSLLELLCHFSSHSLWSLQSHLSPLPVTLLILIFVCLPSLDVLFHFPGRSSLIWRHFTSEAQHSPNLPSSFRSCVRGRKKVPTVTMETEVKEWERNECEYEEVFKICKHEWERQKNNREERQQIRSLSLPVLTQRGLQSIHSCVSFSIIQALTAFLHPWSSSPVVSESFSLFRQERVSMLETRVASIHVNHKSNEIWDEIIKNVFPFGIIFFQEQKSRVLPKFPTIFWIESDRKVQSCPAQLTRHVRSDQIREKERFERTHREFTRHTDWRLNRFALKLISFWQGKRERDVLPSDYRFLCRSVDGSVLRICCCRCRQSLNEWRKEWESRHFEIGERLSSRQKRKRQEISLTDFSLSTSHTRRTLITMHHFDRQISCRMLVVVKRIWHYTILTKANHC